MLSYSGIEPIAAELSGGQFLTPVQTLAATLIFARWAKMQIDSRTLLQAKTPPIRLSESLGRLFGKLQNIAMGRGTVLDYVMSEAQAVVDDLNELDNEEYEL